MNSSKVQGPSRTRLRNARRISRRERLAREELRWLLNERSAPSAGEEKLRTGEVRFRLLVEAVKDYAIFMLDPRGNIRSWNLGAERIKGYRAEEILGKPLSTFYLTEDVKAGKPERLLKAAASEGRVEDEGWRVRKDGSRFWANVVITALRGRRRGLRGFAVITRDATELKRAEDSVRDLSARLLRLQEEERRRVARELHDSTLQTLAALSVNLAVLRERLKVSRDSQLTKALSDAIALADQASDEVRDFSHLLHPPLVGRAGLVKAVRLHVNEFVRRTNISVGLQLPSELRGLSRDAETALFRIVQESLSNVCRHSGSPTAEVRLIPDHTQIILEIIDRGRGFSPAAREQIYVSAAATLGMGIQGMRERVRQLGGRLVIGPAHPGTIVRAILPFARSVAHERPPHLARITAVPEFARRGLVQNAG